ncbi:cytochrome P450 4C1-like [Odontomachus brunneus]|uniref:cytochrome P450 4C1-like n=1 Tax=Odontomachus brunneus TaxID=486640 RepID=UPI0013F23D45|nr:cytochrome P450 4C1-like [Odontomachus brunneus]XP_032675968.1 cytochrome P450 4C1-like [Odontomachus brunneus]XP_032675969.1 cytochrome P450 4C1-like [Odontomachus brunneus]XP_032675970.1 cytochrome P450 4C1-like [Odontomachus brunneus]XP_032675971.1 cytochrome P450 4C1-like [Odontomachus brunneus]XP_032675972.1 cytochrome P450 4C1-like [Odontomachus brunneus]XP_032675973.1 cytochrome P450 4C1-like [Odontomachus brunneus]XP_032675974.1 cytochrome P450 4C1-like [Odontomachus brunneus]
MIVTLLLICFFIMLFHYYIVHFSKKGRLINRIPGVKPLPILGNCLRYAFISPEEMWSHTRNLMVTYYPILKFWYFTVPNVIIVHPDYIENMLNSTKHTVKGFVYELLRPWLGDGLLISKGIKWQNRRKILTSAFHFSILKDFVEIFIEEGNRITESFNHMEESIIENMQFFTSHHTLNAICETSMGISLNDLSSFQQEYRQTVSDISKLITDRFFKPWLYSDTILNLTSLGNKQDLYLNILHSFTEKIIAERRRYHEQSGEQYLKYFENNTKTEDTEVAGIKKKRMAMLDILIAASRNNMLTDSDIREEVDTFVFEGHDTVAIGLCFCLLLLAEHKDIQDRVRTEICEVMQENDGKLTMNALQNLSYLERCIKESLRMYPSVPIISRTCTEDVQLKPYLVPEGTMVHLFIYGLHHDSNFWPNPEVFDPDRFLPENTQKRHPYAYLPFSAGSRNCIGQRFAMLELKALVASMVHKFYLEPVDYLKDVKLKMDIVLRVARPIRMKVIPIKRM